MRIVRSPAATSAASRGLDRHRFREVSEQNTRMIYQTSHSRFDRRTWRAIVTLPARASRAEAAAEVVEHPDGLAMGTWLRQETP